MASRSIPLLGLRMDSNVQQFPGVPMTFSAQARLGLHQGSQALFWFDFQII
jgi:hypothetical protein